MASNYRDHVRSSKGVITRIEEMDLCRVVREDDVVGPFTIIRFKRMIGWVTEIEAYTRLVNKAKNHEVNRGDTHNDFYGFGTSALHQIEQAPKMAEFDGAVPGSPLTLEVVAIIHVKPITTVPPRWGTSGSDNELNVFDIPDSWLIDDGGPSRWMDQINNGQVVIGDTSAERTYLKSIRTDNEVVVWASDWTEEQNAKAMADLMAIKENAYVFP